VHLGHPQVLFRSVHVVVLCAADEHDHGALRADRTQAQVVHHDEEEERARQLQRQDPEQVLEEGGQDAR
jgi:hypothetical protein